MAMNLKNMLMGLGLWFVVSFALHGADVKEGDVAYVREAKELTDATKHIEEAIKADASSAK